MNVMAPPLPLQVTMKRQIQHMIKYKYLPFSYGKKVRILFGYTDDLVGMEMLGSREVSVEAPSWRNVVTLWPSGCFVTCSVTTSSRLRRRALLRLRLWSLALEPQRRS